MPTQGGLRINPSRQSMKTSNLKDNWKMQINIGPSGKLGLQQAPQQVWHGDEPNVMQISRFAGQEMMVIQKSDSESGKYELHYLGFMTGDINGIENAKSKAPEFAKTVLQKMSDLITI